MSEETQSDQEPVYQYVLVCADTQGQDCIYTLHNSVIPPLSSGDALQILGAAALVLGVAWGVGITFRTLFFKTR